MKTELFDDVVDDKPRPWRVISLWQPWASAIELGLKWNETRSWPVSFRGPLLIHAAKRKDAFAREYFDRATCCAPLRIKYGSFNALPFGSIVAAVTLSDCRRAEAVRDSLSPMEEDFGDYNDGRFAWILSDVHEIVTPIPARGAQGFFTWFGSPGLLRPCKR